MRLIDRMAQKQALHTAPNQIDRDVFGLHREGELAAVALMPVREGRMQDARSFSFNRVAEEATMPAITGGVGVCHTYVDSSADINMAADIESNAKVQRPSVCNALDTVSIHSAAALSYLPEIANRFAEAGVEMRCDRRALSMLGSVDGLKAIPVTEEDWTTEHLSLRAGVRIVDSLDEALDESFPASDPPSITQPRDPDGED